MQLSSIFLSWKRLDLYNGDDDFDNFDDLNDCESDVNDDSNNQVYNLSKLTDWRTAYGIGKYTKSAENTLKYTILNYY